MNTSKKNEKTKFILKEKDVLFKFLAQVFRIICYFQNIFSLKKKKKLNNLEVVKSNK